MNRRIIKKRFSLALTLFFINNCWIVWFLGNKENFLFKVIYIFQNPYYLSILIIILITTFIFIGKDLNNPNMFLRYQHYEEYYVSIIKKNLVIYSLLFIINVMMLLILMTVIGNINYKTIVIYYGINNYVYLLLYLFKFYVIMLMLLIFVIFTFYKKQNFLLFIVLTLTIGNIFLYYKGEINIFKNIDFFNLNFLKMLDFKVYSTFFLEIFEFNKTILIYYFIIWRYFKGMLKKDVY